MEMKINSAAILPIIDQNQTQVIYQKCCDFTKLSNYTGSADYQRIVTIAFINQVKHSIPKTELKNIYFILNASYMDLTNVKECSETLNMVYRYIREFLERNGVDETHIVLSNSEMTLDEAKLYSDEFHATNSASRLFIWNIFSNDYLDEYIKNKILEINGSDVMDIANCGGVSIVMEDNLVSININGLDYPLTLEYKKLEYKE